MELPHDIIWLIFEGSPIMLSINKELRKLYLQKHPWVRLTRKRLVEAVKGRDLIFCHNHIRYSLTKGQESKQTSLLPGMRFKCSLKKPLSYTCICNLDGKVYKFTYTLSFLDEHYQIPLRYVFGKRVLYDPLGSW